MAVIDLFLPVVMWFFSKANDLVVGLEETILEFMLLGRIPGTNITIEFEAMLLLSLTAMFSAAIYSILRDPTKT